MCEGGGGGGTTRSHEHSNAKVIAQACSSNTGKELTITVLVPLVAN